MENTPKGGSNEPPQNLISCPLCDSQTPNLVAVDQGLRAGMKEAGLTPIPNSLCSLCIRKWRTKVSKGVQVRAEKENKDNYKEDLWKNRTKLIRHGRVCFSNRVYGEAAVIYEKYLRILEINFKVDRKGLVPSLFKDRTNEITIICSALWDLMRIYDTTEKHHPRQIKTGEKLAEFLRYSPLFPNIIRQAEKEIPNAKNPQVYKNLLKALDSTPSRCFIASCAFESHTHPTVLTLCEFRDKILLQSPLGKKWVALYYKISPGLSARLDHSNGLKKLSRFLLRGVAYVIRNIFLLPD